MPATPSELLQFAKEMHALGGPEVRQRCVVSRAYYACLHKVDETFPASDGETRAEKESSHGFIINRVKVYGKSLKPGRTDASSIAQTLPRLKRLRNSADYDISLEFSAQSCEDMIKRAEHIMSLCEDVRRLRAKAKEAAEAVVTEASASASLRRDESCPPCAATAAKPTLVRVK